MSLLRIIINRPGQLCLKLGTSPVPRFLAASPAKRYISTPIPVDGTGYDTGVQVYSGIRKEKVPLILRHKDYATWYTCGPTVYDSAHIGHASCYVKVDIVQRILRQYFGIGLVTAMNITDIDDKILKQSAQMAHADWRQLAKKYETEFWEELSLLGVQTPDLQLRVTENIDRIIAFITQLCSKGFAYHTNDGSVYFRVSKMASYGKLQRVVLTNATESTHEIGNKESSIDFALWKGARVDEPSWQAPWGAGRPGWHIECSAMASHVFGNTLDFHAGGADLKFPHHENEEAQCCAHHNCSNWVSYWIHTGQLHHTGETVKMSKSLKNTISIRQMLNDYGANQFRMFCLLSHYRSPSEFGADAMQTAASVLRKFKNFQTDMLAYQNNLKPLGHFDASSLLHRLKLTESQIAKALCDDFNTSRTIATLLDLVSHVNDITNRDVMDTDVLHVTSHLGVLQACSNLVNRYMDIFGVQNEFSSATKQCSATLKDPKLDELIDRLVQFRTSLRSDAKTNNTLFNHCDTIRNNLSDYGVEIKDHGGTSSWSYR